MWTCCITPDGPFGHDSHSPLFFPCFGLLSNAQSLVWVISIMISEANGKEKGKQEKLATEQQSLTLLLSPSDRASWLLHNRDYCAHKSSETFPRSRLSDWELWRNIRQTNNTLFSSLRKEQKVMKMNKRKYKHEIWIKETFLAWLFNCLQTIVE